MRDFMIDDIPTRTGWDQRRARQRLMRVLGWLGLSLTVCGIGVVVALTTFAP
jgi:predicted anti-sigma-YlaC factor YlaD